MKSFRKRIRGATKFKGIGQDAKYLGVDRTHLWRVLKKHRSSPLLARWRALQAEKAIRRADKNTPEAK
jgi:hypothetical protein